MIRNIIGVKFTTGGKNYRWRIICGDETLGQINAKALQRVWVQTLSTQTHLETN